MSAMAAAGPMPMQDAPPEPMAARAQAPDPRSIEDVAELAGQMRDIKLKMMIEDYLCLVRFEPGRIEINVADGAPRELCGDLADKLSKWTGKRWIVSLAREAGERPIGVVRREREAAEIDRLKANPALKAVLDAFPEASFKAVRPLKKSK